MPPIMYEVTQTVKPSYKCLYNKEKDIYKDMTASEQFNWYKGIHEQIFQKEHKLETVCFFEFHKNNNLHFHGIVLVPDDLEKIHIVDIRKKCLKIGISKFVPVSNKVKWCEYITKEQTKKNLLDYMIISDNFIDVVYDTFENAQALLQILFLDVKRGDI